MPEETVEVALESFRRFDPADLEPFGRTLHPEAVMTAAEGWPETGPFIGREACVRQMGRLFDDWSDYRLADIEVVEGRGDWVLIAWTLHAKGRASGLDVRLDVVASMRIEDDQIKQAHYRWSADEAREAAGLASKSPDG